MARAYALNDVLVTRMALYLLWSQSPTPPKEPGESTPETRKRPLAADYMDQPPAKEARIARLMTNTNTIKERNKTSESPTIKRHNYYQNRHFGCLHLHPEIYDSPHLYSHHCQMCRNDCLIGLWSYRKLSKLNLRPMAKDTHQTPSKSSY